MQTRRECRNEYIYYIQITFFYATVLLTTLCRIYFSGEKYYDSGFLHAAGLESFGLTFLCKLFFLNRLSSTGHRKFLMHTTTACKYILFILKGKYFREIFEPFKLYFHDRKLAVFGDSMVHLLFAQTQFCKVLVNFTTAAARKVSNNCLLWSSIHHLILLKYSFPHFLMFMSISKKETFFSP